jgi:hypothetical protein
MNAVVNVREHHRLNFNRLPAMAKQQIDTAQLTPMYEDAKRSLAVLARVDEVKEIYDKHAAIAHYAKQIKDNSLLYYAERVYARALARIGELIEDLSFKERKETAAHHGLSLSDANHAVNIAALPKKVIDKFVEQTPPMSKAGLSYEGCRIKNAGRKLQNKTPNRQRNWEIADQFEKHVNREPSAKLAKLIEEIDDYWGIELTQKTDLIDVALISRDDATILRKKLRPLIEYLDEMDHRLELREAGK